MHWRITVEAVDPTGKDGLTDGRIVCSIEDGKRDH